MRRAVVAFVGVVLTVAVWACLRSDPGRADEAAPPADKVERARETARMIDDLYKNFIVQITSANVGGKQKTPAARIALKVFDAMDKKGWHKGKLIDGTGDPVNPANTPGTDFEKQAIAMMKAGKTWHEEIDKDGKRPVLRVATIVPVVMKQCIECHPGRKVGDLLGAIVYEVPIK